MAAETPSLEAINKQVQALQDQLNQLRAKTGPLVVVTQNVDCKFVTYKSSTANAVDPVQHGLQRVPAGMIVVGQDAAGALYTAKDKAPTASTAFVCSSVTGVTYRLLFY